MKSVSIVIPCFNRARFVSSAIESALGQNYPETEVIVVDDGSTDESWSLISSFGERISAFRTKNGGVSRARNFGLSRAGGELIKFVDSDDLLEPGVIESQVSNLANLPCGSIAVGWIGVIDALGQPVETDLYNIRSPRDGSRIQLGTLLSTPIQVSMSMFPRSALIDVGGFRPGFSLGEDYELNLRLYRAGHRFFLFDTPCSSIRQHDDNRISVTCGAREFEQLESLCRENLNLFASEGERTLTHNERIMYGQFIWSIARTAARRGKLSAAHRLFSLGNEIGGRSARTGSWLIRCLYNFVDPIACEKITGTVKRLLGRE